MSTDTLPDDHPQVPADRDAAITDAADAADAASTGAVPVPGARRPLSKWAPLVGGLALLAAGIGLFAPSAVVPSAMGASMTHYMELLSVRQPWNLLTFMAGPVVLAEVLAITELAILFGRAPRWVYGLSRLAGLLAGPLMLGILLHLVRHAVVPLTAGQGWRGAADVVAVLSYLAGAFPMIGITLVELGVLGRTPAAARRLHVVFVAIFLVVAHVAMIFGMLDPTLLGWQATWDGTGPMPATMPGMNHGG